MTINQQAVEAAALVLVGVTGEPRVGRFERTMANAILEAAMPHIREQIAQEIEALRVDREKADVPHCIDEYNAGLTNAALRARGEA